MGEYKLNVSQHVIATKKKANTVGCVKGQLIQTREVITLLSFLLIKAHQVIILFSSR